MSKFGVLGYRNPQLIENPVHIRSTDHFKQVRVRGKMTNEINMDDHCVWMCIRVTFSSIGKVLGLPDC